MMTPDEDSSGCFLLARKPQKICATRLDLNACPGDHIGGFVKIAIISGIHSNLAALDALPEKIYDELWCLGDLVGHELKAT